MVLIDLGQSCIRLDQFNWIEVQASKFGALRQDRGVEFHCFGHVAFDLHLAVHESILRLQLALEKADEVCIEHDEGSVSLAFFAEHNVSIAVLEVDGNELGILVALSHAQLEVVDGADLGDNTGTLRGEEGLDFLEELNGLHIY